MKIGQQPQKGSVSPWKHLVQQDKREAALLRQAERDARTPEEQLGLITFRRGASNKERHRLLNQLDNE